MLLSSRKYYNFIFNFFQIFYILSYLDSYEPHPTRVNFRITKYDTFLLQVLVNFKIKFTHMFTSMKYFCFFSLDFFKNLRIQLWMKPIQMPWQYEASNLIEKLYIIPKQTNKQTKVNMIIVKDAFWYSVGVFNKRIQISLCPEAGTLIREQ